MKKLIALSYLAVPLALSVMKLMPAIVATVLFGIPIFGGGLSAPIWSLIIGVVGSGVFSFFVSGFFPTSGGFANFIMAL